MCGKKDCPRRQAESAFSSLIGGAGDDKLTALDSAASPANVIMGGLDNDTIIIKTLTPVWLDGGQDRVKYSDDGTDTVDYSQIDATGGLRFIGLRISGQETSEADEHKKPDILVQKRKLSFGATTDKLFSIEKIT